MPPKKPGTADKKKAAKKKGKLDINLKKDEELVPINCNPTDTVLELKQTILEVLAELAEEAARAEAEAAGTEYAAPPADEGDPALMALLLDGNFLDDNDATLQDLGFTKDTVVELPKPLPQTGSGSFQFPNGAIYTGEWKLFNREKARHGLGKFINGSETYEGNWVKDVIEGEGEYRFASGAIYTGSFVGAQFQGKGTYTFKDGVTSYTGNWEANAMHGTGSFTHRSGDKFEGRFEKNLFLNDQGHWIPIPAEYSYLEMAKK